MNRGRMLALVAAAAALAAGPFAAQAAEKRPMTPQEERLEAAQRELAARAAATKGAPQQEILMERKRVESLIDALESGHSVDPREIDAALERANRVP